MTPDFKSPLASIEPAPALAGRSVLLIEDELALSEAIRMSLKTLRLRCQWAKNLKEAKAKIESEAFDFWILDRQLPDGDGLSLLPKRPQATQVLVLSAKSEIEERVKGLRAGAEDYLPKPFSFAELGARLEVMARRIDLQALSVSTSAWMLNEAKLEVQSPQGVHSLTPLEFKFMKYLFEHQNVIISKDRLLKEVWGFSFLPKTRTVDYLLTQLRKRLEPVPDAPKHLITVRGAGVKFVPS